MYGSPVSGSFLGTCAPVYQTTSIVPSFSFAVLATGFASDAAKNSSA